MYIGANTKTKDTIKYNLDDLIPSNYYPDNHLSLPKLRKSIKEEGMRHPLVITLWARETYLKHVEDRKNKNAFSREHVTKNWPKPPDKDFLMVIVTGSQRFKILKEMGCTETDVIIVDKKSDKLKYSKWRDESFSAREIKKLL